MGNMIIAHCVYKLSAIGSPSPPYNSFIFIHLIPHPHLSHLTTLNLHPLHTSLFTSNLMHFSQDPLHTSCTSPPHTQDPPHFLSTLNLIQFMLPYPHTSSTSSSPPHISFTFLVHFTPPHPPAIIYKCYLIERRCPHLKLYMHSYNSHLCKSTVALCIVMVFIRTRVRLSTR